MAVRSIQVNFGADISNFQQNVTRAERTLGSLGSEARNAMQRITANTQLLISQLGNGGSAAQRMAIQSQGLTQRLQIQSAHTNRLQNELNRATQTYGRQSTEVRRLELQLLRAAHAEQEMRNELQRLNQTGGSSRLSQLFSGLSQNMGGGALSSGLTTALAGGGLMGLAIGGGMALIEGLKSAISGLVDKLKEGAQAGLEFNKNIEVSKIALTTMLGSADAADLLSQKLLKFAAITPFEFPELMDSTKRLLAFGFEADQLLNILKSVGDAASGLGSGQEGINILLRALGQIKSKGRVQSQELLQLQEAGVGATKMLADSFGVTEAKMLDMVEKGMVPAGKALNILINGMEAKFPDMMAKMSNSWVGMATTIRDYTNMALGTAMKPFFEFVKNNIFPALINGIQASVPYVQFFTNVVITGFQALMPAFESVKSGFMALWVQIQQFVTANKDNIKVFVSSIAMMAQLSIAHLAGLTSAFVEFGKAAYNAVKAGYNVTQAFANIRLGNFTDAKNNMVDIFNYSKDAGKHILGVGSAYVDTYKSSANAFKGGIESAFDTLKTSGGKGEDILKGLTSKYIATVPGAIKDATKDGSDKAKKELENFIDKVKNQAQQYRDSLGLFEKATIEKLSGEKLMVRLKSQLKVFDNWAAAIKSLKGRLGEDSELFRQVLSQGPKAAGQAMALSRLDDSRLAEYKSLFGRKSNIALEMGAMAATGQMIADKKVENISVNINGGVITNNVQDLVNLITKAIRDSGVM